VHRYKRCDRLMHRPIGNYRPRSRRKSLISAAQRGPMSVCVSVTTVSWVKTAKPIEIPSGMLVRDSTRNHEMGVEIFRVKGKFWRDDDGMTTIASHNALCFPVSRVAVARPSARRNYLAHALTLTFDLDFELEFKSLWSLTIYTRKNQGQRSVDSENRVERTNKQMNGGHIRPIFAYRMATLTIKMATYTIAKHWCPSSSSSSSYILLKNKSHYK